MKKTEILKQIKKMSDNPRISKLFYSFDIVADDKDDPCWYGGYLLSYVVDNKYKVSYFANGDNRGTLVYKEKNYKIEEEPYKDSSNTGYLGRLLEQKGITKDSDIIFENYPANISYASELFDEQEDKIAILFQDYSNWFEFEMVDCQTNEKISNYFDMDAVVDFESMYDNDLDFFDSIYKSYCEIKRD